VQHLLLDRHTVVVGSTDESVEDEVRQEVLRNGGIFELEKTFERTEDLASLLPLDLAVQFDCEASNPISEVGDFFRLVDRKLCCRRRRHLFELELSTEKRRTCLLNRRRETSPDLLFLRVGSRIGCRSSDSRSVEAAEFEKFLNRNGEEFLMLRVVRTPIGADEEILNEPKSEPD
jgi:hypothetical protein